MSKREELEKLEREDLEEEARNIGVARPEVLTREEILDAIEALEERASGSREGSKGFLGRMRLVLAAFVERGLNLPEAAERIRAGTATPAPEPIPMATVTLAEIYAAQGHTERALAVLDQILRAEPEHASALRLRARLRGQPLPIQDEDDEDDEDDLPAPPPPPAAPAPAPSVVTAPSSPVLVVHPPAPAPKAPETEATSTSASPVLAPSGPPRPAPMLDEEPLPERYEIDEIVLMPVDPTTLYLYWEIQPALIEEAKQIAPGGQLVMRLDQRVGERYRTLRLLPVAPIGDTQFGGLPIGAECIAILGLRTEFQWVPLLRSEPRTLPPDVGVPEVARQVVQWREDKTVVAPPAEVPPALELAVAILPRPSPPEPAPAPEAQLSPEVPLILASSAAPDLPPEWTQWPEDPGLTAEAEDTPQEQPSRAPLGSSERWLRGRRPPIGASERLVKGR